MCGRIFSSHPGGFTALEPGVRDQNQANDPSLPWWEGVKKKLALLHSAGTKQGTIGLTEKDMRFRDYCTVALRLRTSPIFRLSRGFHFHSIDLSGDVTGKVVRL